MYPKLQQSNCEHWLTLLLVNLVLSGLIGEKAGDEHMTSTTLNSALIK